MSTAGNESTPIQLVAPRVVPSLDPQFRPAALATRAFRDRARALPGAQPIRLALEQTDGSIFHFATVLLPPGHPEAGANFVHLERLAKLLLWSRGGFRFHLDGPAELAAQLAAHYRDTPTGRFDSEIVGQRIFGRPLEVVATARAALRTSEHHAAGPTPRWLPHRLRSGRQRSQGGGGDRRRGGLERGDRVGSLPAGRSRSTTSDGIEDSLRRGGRAPAPRRRHRRLARPGSTSTARSGWPRCFAASPATGSSAR